jgi:geranylgeranyl diphosphate synthase, type II
MDIKTYLKEKRELVDSYLQSYFDRPMSPALLSDAMKYSLFAGGKRIRPTLAFASYEACGGDPVDIIPQAAALELIHTYSLIHDDLPSMDNDDLRRGKPTSHRVFGEAIAILAGDALLTEAFSMMTIINPPIAPLENGVIPTSDPLEKGGREGFPRARISPAALLKAVAEVARSSGASGMVGGQVQDILSENTKPDKDALEFIHMHKTAALIAASVKMGPILAGSSKKILKALTIYGENIGLVFQIIDDILDVEGTAGTLGKMTGSDSRKKKMTYPSLFGIEGARQRAEDLIIKAVDAVASFSPESGRLTGIARYLLDRRA